MICILNCDFVYFYFHLCSAINCVQQVFKYIILCESLNQFNLAQSSMAPAKGSRTTSIGRFSKSFKKKSASSEKVAEAANNDETPTAEAKPPIKDPKPPSSATPRGVVLRKKANDGINKSKRVAANRVRVLINEKKRFSFEIKMIALLVLHAGFV